MKKEAEVKDAYEFPLTANHEYGWRQPIDDLSPNYGMKQTFDEKLMMTLKGLKQAKKWCNILYSLHLFQPILIGFLIFKRADRTV